MRGVCKRILVDGFCHISDNIQLNSFQGFLADYCEKISATLTDSLIGEY